MSEAIQHEENRVVEFHSPGRLGPEVEMPPELLITAESLNGRRCTVREAIAAFESADPECTVYDQGDCIAIGFGERVEVIPGTTLHKHNYRAIWMRLTSEGFSGSADLDCNTSHMGGGGSLDSCGGVAGGCGSSGAIIDGRYVGSGGGS